MWLVLGSDAAERIAEALGSQDLAAEWLQVVRVRVNPTLESELNSIRSLETAFFTSRTSVDLVYSHSEPRVRSLVSMSRCYAIGPSTGSLVSQRFHPTKLSIPREFSSEGLIRLIDTEELGICGLFSSEKRSTRLSEELRRHSKVFYQPVLYDLEFAKEMEDAAARALGKSEVRGVVFTCSTAFNGLPPDALDILKPKKIIAMGERTASTIRKAGLECLVPENSEIHSVVAAAKRIGAA